jgi:hypothetical protein
MVVEEKTIAQQCHIAGQQQHGISICCMPRQLLLCCSLRKISSGANLAPESLHTVCTSDSLQGAQVAVAHFSVTYKVDCSEEFYSFTNQAFVSRHLGVSQE